MSTATNPLGVPESAEEWAAALDDIARRCPIPPIVSPDVERGHVDFIEGVARGLQIMEATGRWSFTHVPPRQPARYVPGDVVALRSKTVLDYVLFSPGQDDDAGVHHDALPLGSTLASAVPYWLPAGAATAVLDSEPPADAGDLSLPYPAVSVWFAEPLIPSAPLRPAGLGELAAGLDMRAGAAPAYPTSLEYPMAKAAEALTAADRDLERSRIEGVLLLADDDGRPIDPAAWVLADHESPGMPQRTPILARPSAAGWRATLGMLTAIVAWGDWHAPADPIELSHRPSREEFRGLRYGRTRRREEAGALAGVLVLDAQRRAKATSPTVGGHAAPAAHLRRGHYHRYRHGPNEDWHYETHWIPPLLVNPDGRADPRPRVYRLPPPSP